MDKESFITKDVYEHILNFADDREVIIMLSKINRRMRQGLEDDFFFQRLLEKRYPLLIKFKKENETWYHFYLRMAKYIFLLKEKFGIPYLPLEDFNPEDYYNAYTNIPFAVYDATELILMKGGNYDILKVLLNKLEEQSKTHAFSFSLRHTLNDLLNTAVETGDLQAVIILLEKGADDYSSILENAAFSGDLNIIKYVLENIYPRGSITKDEITQAILTTEDEEIKEYLRNFL